MSLAEREIHWPELWREAGHFQWLMTSVNFLSERKLRAICPKKEMQAMHENVSKITA